MPRWSLLAFVSFLVLGTYGCTRYARITHDQFRLSDFRGSTKALQGPLKKIRLSIDRKTKKITLTHTSGSSEVVSYRIRPKADWVLGCPGKQAHTLQVIELQVPQVVIGRFTIKQPILQAASCRSGGGFYLREAAQIKQKAAWKCEMAQMCLRFQPLSSGPASQPAK